MRGRVEQAAILQGLLGETVGHVYGKKNTCEECGGDSRLDDTWQEMDMLDM